MVRGEAFLSFERGPRPDIHTYCMSAAFFACCMHTLQVRIRSLPVFLVLSYCSSELSWQHSAVYILYIWGIEYGVTVKTSFLNLSRRADSNHVQYSYHTTMEKNDIFLYSIFSVFGIF